MAENLPQLRRRHQALAARLGQVGFAVSGSLTRRYTRCGKPGCRCQADPPQLHEVPRGFRTVHPLGWMSGKVK